MLANWTNEDFANWIRMGNNGHANILLSKLEQNSMKEDISSIENIDVNLAEKIIDLCKRKEIILSIWKKLNNAKSKEEYDYYSVEWGKILSDTEVLSEASGRK